MVTAQFLRLGEPLGPLTFAPVEMPPSHKVLWYIYSRNMVQKGRNFTHFAKRDYLLLASIIAKVPYNIGKWVLNEMRRFQFES